MRPTGGPTNRAIRATVVVLAVVGLLHPILFRENVLLYTEYGRHMDLVQQYYPWRRFVHDSLRAGHLPLWNPYTFAGGPVVPNMQIGLFFPLYLLFFVLPTAEAFTYSFLVVLVAAGLSMFAFLGQFDLDGRDRLVGALSFSLSGALVGHLVPGHLPVIAATALVPLVFAAYERAIDSGDLRDVAICGVAFALQFLAGHPQSTYNTVLLVGLYALVRTSDGVPSRESLARLARLFGVSGTVALALSGIQLVPSLYFFPRSSRTGGFGVESATILPGLFRAYRLTDLAIPNLLGGLPFHWTQSYYAGVVPLFLAAFAVPVARERRPVRALTAVGGVALVLSLGPLTPIYTVYFHVVPFADLFRVPGRFTVFVSFAIASLSAFGLARLRAAEPLPDWVWGLPAAVVLADLAVLAVVGLLYGDVLAAVPAGYGDYRAQLAGEKGAVVGTVLVSLLQAGVAVGLVACYRRRPGWRPAVGNLFVVVLVAGMLFHYGGLVGAASTDRVAGPDRVPATDGRVYDANMTSWGWSAVLNEGTNVLRDVRSVGGYNPYHLRSVDRRYRRLEAAPPARREAMLDALNVSYVIAAANESRGENYTAVGTVEGRPLLHNDDALPKAFFVPRSAVSGEQPSMFEPGTVDAAVPVAVRTTPDRVVVTATVDEPGYLVVSTNYYELWSGRLDGRQVRLERTTSGLIAVPVEAGTHRLVLRYRLTAVLLGALVSVLGGALVAACYVLARRGRQLRP